MIPTAGAEKDNSWCRKRQQLVQKRQQLGQKKQQLGHMDLYNKFLCYDINVFLITTIL
jgi:hypothetical protein